VIPVQNETNLNKTAGIGDKSKEVSGDIVRALSPVELLVNDLHHVVFDDRLHALVPKFNNKSSSSVNRTKGGRSVLRSDEILRSVHLTSSLR
jgi:hypothetical protein